MTRYKLERIGSTIKADRIVEILTASKAPLTAPELALHIHIQRDNLDRLLRAMRDQGMIYVKSWTHEPVASMKTSRWRQQWAAGNREDAPKPPPIEPAALVRAYRQRMKEDPARYSEYLAAARHRGRMRDFKPRPDIAAQWIFKQAT